jgi:hypothetical protein
VWRGRITGARAAAICLLLRRKGAAHQRRGEFHQAVGRLTQALDFASACKRSQSLCMAQRALVVAKEVAAEAAASERPQSEGGGGGLGRSWMGGKLGAALEDARDATAADPTCERAVEALHTVLIQAHGGE